jgi:hypothetical protein
MRMMNSWRKPIQLLLWAVSLFLVGLACNLELSEFRIDQNEPTGTNPTAELLTPSGGITPTPGDSGAACLPGVWQIDHESVIEYMRDTMTGVGETAYTPLSSEGTLELQIESREMTLVAEDFKVNVGVKIGGDPDATSNETTVQADASANYLASDTQINLTDISYDIGGTLKSDNRLYNMELEDLLVIVNTYGFARDLSLPVESTFFSYTCSGDSLSIVVNDFASVSFNREQ